MDLYKADFSKISGIELYEAIKQFTRLDQPLDERPSEGYLLDFNEDWSEGSLNVVASFANTFGGLLIVGITEQNGRPEKIVGMTSRGEVKTRLASSIASNIFPVAPFEICDCEMPANPSRRLCVVRVRSSSDVCFLTRKGIPNPIYVRIEDQSRPADAAQMRALLEKRAAALTSPLDSDERLQWWRQELYVTTGPLPDGSRSQSDTSLRMLVTPVSHSTMPIDLTVERNFSETVFNTFPGHRFLAPSASATMEMRRGRDWFELSILERNHDYERRWRVSSRGEIGFVTQTRWPIHGMGDCWSLLDVIADLTYFLRAAKRFWTSSGYYGEASFAGALSVRRLKLCEDRGFPPLFYQLVSPAIPFGVDRAAVALAEKPGVVGSAETYLEYLSSEEYVVDAVAHIVNQLLRSLGHGTDLARLRRVIQAL